MLQDVDCNARLEAGVLCSMQAACVPPLECAGAWAAFVDPITLIGAADLQSDCRARQAR
jgi:hypothetical protein